MGKFNGIVLAQKNTKKGKRPDFQTLPVIDLWVLCLTYSLYFLCVLGYFWFGDVFSVKADRYDFVYRFHMFVVEKKNSLHPRSV